MPFEMKYGSLSYVFSLSQFEEMMETEDRKFRDAPEEKKKRRKGALKTCKQFIKNSVTRAGKSQ